MALIWNPDTNSYEWDYSNGGPPNSQAPWDPATGQDLPPPPETNWDATAGRWAPTTPTAAADPTTDQGKGPTPSLDPPIQPPGGPISTSTTFGGAPSGRPVNGISDWGPQFSGPTFSAPQPFTYADFQGATPFQPGQFSFDGFTTTPFVAPTAEEAAAEPGYAFADQQGRQALEGSKAAEGVYRTGGTLKDLYGWTNKFAEQNYGNVFNRKLTTQQNNENQAFQAWQGNRNNAFGNFQANETNALDAWKANEGDKFQTWQANRNNAASNYATNYGVSRDVFDRAYQGALDQFAPKQAYAQLDFGRQWSDYLAKLDLTKTLVNAGAN